MPNINLLPDYLIKQIAAGEVVERPASVVKELVENSLDSGATKIEISLEDGGKSSIEVRDNGQGIDKSELPKTIVKHATSKIKSLEDLQSVLSFGFRGEALASISSVARTIIASKTDSMLCGQALEVSGQETKTYEYPMNTGTIVKVYNLFEYTPARKHYLKTDNTEFRKIREVLYAFALFHSHVSFVLRHNDKEVCSFREDEPLEQRIQKIYGDEFADNLVSVDSDYHGIQLSGYITHPRVSFSDTKKQYIFVNGRCISSPMIAKAIKEAYARFIAPKTYPGYVLCLTIDPTIIDANVHPRKLEIRFSDEQTIYRTFYHSLKQKLESLSLLGNTEKGSDSHHVQSPFKTSPISSPSPKYHISSGLKFKSYSPYTSTAPNPSQAAIEFTKALNSDLKHTSSDLRQTPLGYIIGQLHNSYIVVQSESGCLILDQHALAERVIYEKISKTAYTPKLQTLLSPIFIQLSGEQIEIVEEYKEVFGDIGLEIDMLPGNTFSLSNIPDFMKQKNIEKTLIEILEDVNSVGSKSFEEIRNKIFAYTACRSAVKFGDTLSLFEMHGLLKESSLHYVSTCPHGRPVAFELSLDELKGKYDR